MRRERDVRAQLLQPDYRPQPQPKPKFRNGLHATFHEAFSAMYAGEALPEMGRTHANWANCFSRSLKGNQPLLRILHAICREGVVSILAHRDVRRGIFNLANWRFCFRRTPESWKAPKGNFQVIFRTLLHHLISRYSLPAFLDRVWFRFNQNEQALYIDLANGHAVYGHHLLEQAKLSRKMAHQFGQAPGNATVIHAVRWAQVMSASSCKRLYRVIINSFLGTALENDDFWSGMIRWLGQQQDRDLKQVRPMVRFLNYWKYGRFSIGKQTVPLRPVAPDFSLKGRNFASVLKLMQQFEASLKMDQSLREASWMPIPIPNYDCGRHTNPENQKRHYRIVQLLNYEQLVREGAEQQHCIASYSDFCRRGEGSVWSLRELGSEGEKPCVTIYLDNVFFKISEVRGLYNRLPNELEAQLVKNWAEQIKAELPLYALC